MSLDHYVTLGHSGLLVSPFCLGGMTFGNDFGFGTDAKTSAQLMDTYIDRGGNFIDSANMYNRGNSESIIGEHLRGDPEKRDRLVLATKYSSNMTPGVANVGGANRKAIIAACEASLKRLQTDHIDLYWQHWNDPFTPIEETMRALNDLVDAGKVLYLGFSDTPAWRVAEAQLTTRFRGWTPLVALQIEYSLLERTVEAELIPMARSMGLGVTPWAPLRVGMLTGKYSREDSKADSAGRQGSLERNFHEQAFKVVDVVKDIASQRETTPARVALSWVRGRPGVAAPIIGARTVDQLLDNLEALELELTADDLKALDDISTPKLHFPFEFLNAAMQASYSGLSVNGQSFGSHAMAKAD